MQSISDALSSSRPLLAKLPQDTQLKMLWLLLEAVAADTDQLKAYVEALHESFMRYAGVVEAYSKANAEHADKLRADMENLLKEFV